MMQNSPKPDTAEMDSRFAPLRQVIARLGASGTDLPGRYDAPAESFAGLIELIAREIDETVLPRHVELRDQSGTRATLTISNRRLVGLQMPGDKSSNEAAGIDSAGQAATYFARRLRRLSEASGALGLHLAGRAEGFTVEDISCSGPDLEAAANAASDGSRLDAFLAQIRSSACVWLLREDPDTPPTQDGPSELCESLRAVDKELLRLLSEQGASFRRNAAKPTCTIMPFTQSRRMILATERKSVLLAIAEDSDMSGIMDAWNGVFRA